MCNQPFFHAMADPAADLLIYIISVIVLSTKILFAEMTHGLAKSYKVLQSLT